MNQADFAAELIERLPKTAVALEIMSAAYSIIQLEGLTSHAPLIDLFEPFIVDEVPGAPFTTPLGDVLPAHKTVQHFYDVVKRHQKSLPKLYGHFTLHFRAQKQTYPRQSKLDGRELYVAYLSKTPFFNFMFGAGVPVELKQRFNHTHIVGDTGSGKSTLLKNLIAHDLKSNACVIVLDPHRQLAPELSTLKLNREVVLIDATDPPGINIFDVEDVADPIERERVFAHVVDMFSHIFRDEDTKLTGKQNIAFENLCHLILALKQTRHRSGTLKDLFDFLANPKTFETDIAALDPFIASFFDEFTPKNAEYRETPGQIRYRLRSILSKPSLRKMFSARHTQLDFRREMDRGSLILIDADLDFLGNVTSAFGRIFLSLIMETARQRGTNARPTYLYVDEAHRFFDGEQLSTLLTDARKYNVGCTLAHQNLEQIKSSAMLGALRGVGTKITGRLSMEDARKLAPNMDTAPEHLRFVPQHHFTIHQSNASSAVTVLPKGDPLAKLPRLSDAEYHAFKVANRDRYAATSEADAPTAGAPTSAAAEDTDEW